MKHKKILFVCTGNTCRSPMAEAALRAELKKRKIKWYTVASAGLRAEEGCPMTDHSVTALGEAGIECPQAFRSRRISAKMLREADAVICMTQSQHRLLYKFPNATSMYELAGREIPDPFGQGIDAYRITLRVIRECIPQIIAALHIGE